MPLPLPPHILSLGEPREANSLRLHADALPHLVWTAHPDGNLANVNQRWLDYTLTEDESRGRPWQQMVHPDNLPQCLGRWTRAIDDRQPLEIELRLRSRGGDYRWFVVRAEPHFDQEQQPICWIGTCTDITRSKEAELALAEKLEQLAGATELGRLEIDFRQSESEFRNLFELSAAGAAQLVRLSMRRDTS